LHYGSQQLLEKPAAQSYADGNRRRRAVGIDLVGSSRMAVGVAIAVGLAR
jgi:hypothetical protein